jgi:hypothetical protein
MFWEEMPCIVITRASEKFFRHGNDQPHCMASHLQLICGFRSNERSKSCTMDMYTLSVFTGVLYPSFDFNIDLTSCLNLREIRTFPRRRPIALKFIFCAVSVRRLPTKFCANLAEGIWVSECKILTICKALIFRFAQPFQDQWLLYVPAIT